MIPGLSVGCSTCIWDTGIDDVGATDTELYALGVVSDIVCTFVVLLQMVAGATSGVLLGISAAVHGSASGFGAVNP